MTTHRNATGVRRPGSRNAIDQWAADVDHLIGPNIDLWAIVTDDAIDRLAAAVANA